MNSQNLPPSGGAPLRPEPATAPATAAPPQTIIVQQPTGGRWQRFVSWFGWMGFLFCIPIILGMAATYREYFDVTGNIQEKYHSLSKDADDKIAVIDITGVIMEGDGFVKDQIDRVRDDDKVKAVVVRIDSPGGTITGSDYLYHHLIKLRDEKKVPLVVSMGSMAASGGYYIAMSVGNQSQSIFAEPTTTTGSIGVIIPHYDLSGMLQRLDIKNDSIASHPRKQLLSMTKPISDEDRQILQQLVNQSFERFKETVRAGRPKLAQDPEALDKLATGEIFTGTQAQELGLVDELGFIEDAIERVAQMANLDKDDVRVVSYERTPSLVDALAGAQAHSQSWERMALEWHVPRAYYILTTLPSLLHTAPPAR